MPTLFTSLIARHPESTPVHPPDEAVAEPILQSVRSIPAPTLAEGVVAASPAQRDVVIIGAGFAGLSAAYELRALGYNVTVYEARGRGEVR